MTLKQISTTLLLALALGLPQLGHASNLESNCMENGLEDRFNRGSFVYKQDTFEEVSINLCDFIDGAADLTGCEDVSQYLVITTSRERFLELNGRNENKIVMFMGPHHLVQDLLPSYPNALYPDLLPSYPSTQNPYTSPDNSSTQHPFVFLWRCGWTNVNDFVYRKSSTKGLEGSFSDCWEQYRFSRNAAGGVWLVATRAGHMCLENTQRMLSRFAFQLAKDNEQFPTGYPVAPDLK